MVLRPPTRRRWFPSLCLGLILGLVTAVMSVDAAASPPQYLLFQIFLGAPDANGVFHRGASKQDLLRTAQLIASTVRPDRPAPDHILGFSLGPIAMDEGADEVKSVIRDAFETAAATGLAVALHLDDYMMWSQARGPDGRPLGANPASSEWHDWSRTPAGSLKIDWLPHATLPPQMCYESTSVRNFASYWTRDVIGREVKKQFDLLRQAGKARLFAGVITGWESNLAHGYCSLSELGYSAQNPPSDFEHAREQVLQRHIERWAKGIYDAGIPRELIFTHLGPIPKRDYDQLRAVMPRERIIEMPQATAFRAFWTAFNRYSNPGFSGYPNEGIFGDIDASMRQYGGKDWAMAEGTNVLPAAPGGRSPLTWETYLARSFNHGAKLVNLFGGFQGPAAGEFGRATESPEALAAYRQFLSGIPLAE